MNYCFKYLSILALALLINGCYSPKEKQPLLVIDVSYLNINLDISAENIEKQVSRPLEGYATGKIKIKHVYSASFRDGAVVTFAFPLETDPNIAKQKIKLLLLEATKNKILPDYLPEPEISVRNCPNETC